MIAESLDDFRYDDGFRENLFGGVLQLNQWGRKHRHRFRD